MTITFDEVNEILKLEGGSLIWRKRGIPWFDSKLAGKRAGTLREDGYRSILIGGKGYLEHHLVWLMNNGEFPESPLDHINRNRADNRPENLRQVQAVENSWNTGLYKNNTSGVKGVTVDKNTGKFRVRICTKGIRKSLGTFNTLELALEAYNRAANERSV